MLGVFYSPIVGGGEPFWSPRPRPLPDPSVIAKLRVQRHGRHGLHRRRQPPQKRVARRRGEPWEPVEPQHSAGRCRGPMHFLPFGSDIVFE